MLKKSVHLFSDHRFQVDQR
jgi:hypothetical protein